MPDSLLMQLAGAIANATSPDWDAAQSTTSSCTGAGSSRSSGLSPSAHDVLCLDVAMYETRLVDGSDRGLM
jgi:hypothetical protein